MPENPAYPRSSLIEQGIACLRQHQAEFIKDFVPLYIKTAHSEEKARFQATQNFQEFIQRLEQPGLGINDKLVAAIRLALGQGVNIEDLLSQSEQVHNVFVSQVKRLTPSAFSPEVAQALLRRLDVLASHYRTNLRMIAANYALEKLSEG